MTAIVGRDSFRPMVASTHRRRSLAALSILAVAWMPAGAAAQAALPPPSEAAKALVGQWEMSNADKDRVCNVSFKLDASGPGRAIVLDKTCATVFPLTKDTVAWTITKDDAVRLIDAKGKVLVEFTEVESGLYEGIPPGESLMFLQTAAAVTPQQQRTADQMFGDWAITRGAARAVCQITFGSTAADPDNFVLTVRPGCDQQIARFGPVSWRLDRGQLVLLSAKGDAWRFEESEPMTWRRIPEARPPIILIKPQ